MFKRSLLGLAFVAALVAASLVTTGKSAAHGCDYGYGGYGYRTSYYPSYASSYYGYGYGPRVVAYPGAYPAYYRGYDGGHHGHHHHHDHDGGLTVSFGF